MKREFSRLVKRTRFKFDMNYVYEEKRKNSLYKVVFKYILSILFIIYDSFLINYFDNESILFTLDMFMIYKWIYKSYYIFSNINQSKISILSKNFTFRRSAFICLFINNMKIQYSFYFYKLLFNNISNILNPIIKLQSLFSFIFLDLFLNKSMLFSTNKLINSSWNIKLIRFSLIHFAKFFEFQYTAFSYYSLSEITSINI